jgi:hypothetical protein
MEVAERDPEYLLWAMDNVQGNNITDAAVAKAVQVLDRGDYYDYDDEQLTIRMTFGEGGRSEDYY